MEVFVVYELVDQQHGDGAQASVHGVFVDEKKAWKEAKEWADHYMELGYEGDELDKTSNGYTIYSEYKGMTTDITIEIKKMTIDKEGG